MNLDSMKEILAAARREEKPLWEIIVETDMENRGATREDSFAKMSRAWHAMLDFALKAKEYVPNVVMTIVDKDKSEEEVDRCRQIVRDLGVTLRIRSYIED